MPVFNPDAGSDPGYDWSRSIRGLLMTRIYPSRAQGGHKHRGPLREILALVDVQHGRDGLINRAERLTVLFGSPSARCADPSGLRKVHDKEMWQRENRVSVPMSARRLLEVLLNVRDHAIGTALGLQGSAHLIIRIGLRSCQLIERLVHKKDGAVSSAAQIQVVEDTGRSRITPAKLEGVPVNAMFLDGDACDDRRHCRQSQGGFDCAR
jgi:hypothetical protein